MEMEISLSMVIEPQLFVTFFPIGLVWVAAGIIGKSSLQSFTVIQHIVSEGEQKMCAPVVARVTLSLVHQVF